jgi:predicted Rossmann-fold nucleotide-binding protein
MDEVFEALTLAQLHLYHKPIGILNTEGYYDPLIAMLNNMVKFGFLKPENRALCIIEHDMDVLLSRMRNYRYDPIPKWM